MTDHNRPTVGQIATDLQLKQDYQVSVLEQMRENLTDYEKNIYECIQTHKKVFPGSFYIVVITKKEPLMQNVMRNYFFARLSCPTPDYDQTLYKYSPESEQIDFIWVIPSKYACLLMLENKGEISPTEYALLNYVLKFKDGSLFRLAQQMNNEESMKGLS